jgi:choline dehydrogenase
MMHIRGDRPSYDAWEAAGATDWRYDTLLPYFKRSEQAEGDPDYRGARGPMQVAPGPGGDPLWEASFQAAIDAGHARNEDANGPTADGVRGTR